ncbi:hypothetical protein [Pseudoalteromonas rubra]|uniref:hypothetical protein n=1 Tax=Pseudoalteromonas rubra TaxID=43658 RepID=UPI000F7AFA8A|nr:hypothetical protein [Pseudoalteromonas rubra]
MKKLPLTACILAALLGLSTLAHANSQISDQAMAEFKEMQVAFNEGANALGMSAERYADVAQKYERFMTKLAAPAGYHDSEVPDDILPFNQIPAVQEAKYHADGYSPEFEQRLRAEINQNDARLATYLGLTTEQLHPFVKQYSQFVMDGRVMSDNMMGKGNFSIKAMERFECVCRSECGSFGMTSLDYLHLREGLRALHSGGYYTDVKVVTRNRDGSYHDTAIWRVRMDGRIWRERAANCDNEISCHQEP